MDETKFEVKQDPRIKLNKTNKCKYCHLEASLFPTTCCGFKQPGLRCSRPFHVRCAIKRGLITDYETMKEFQSVNGRAVAMCAHHTR